jgi:peptidoglycan endopeptidase LytE
MNKRNLKLCIAVLTIILTIFLGSMNVQADYGSTTLRYGMRGNDVKTLQIKLQNLGYFNHKVTGYFGSVTKTSVLNFQKANGLSADGIVGKNTYKALNNAQSAGTLSSRGASGKATASNIISTAKSYIGVPYVWGGTSPKGFDCSGFVQYVFGKYKIALPRTAATIYGKGIAVSKSNLIAGDLVFFTTYKAGASHVGIYIGNGNFIHASSSKGVIISNLSNSYYLQRYIGAKRIL